MTIEQARDNIGKKVVYTPFDGCNPSMLEYGVITSVRKATVFVRYGSDVNSKGTDPWDLRFDR